jgi:hypothetical protein
MAHMVVQPSGTHGEPRADTSEQSQREVCPERERGCFRWGRLESLRLFLKGLAEGTYKTKHAEAY